LRLGAVVAVVVRSGRRKRKEEEISLKAKAKGTEDSGGALLFNLGDSNNDTGGQSLLPPPDGAAL
jgi:hypothetical protein